MEGNTLGKANHSTSFDHKRWRGTGIKGSRIIQDGPSAIIQTVDKILHIIDIQLVKLSMAGEDERGLGEYPCPRGITRGG